jgi:hypothetical protein
MIVEGFERKEWEDMLAGVFIYASVSHGQRRKELEEFGERLKKKILEHGDV